MADILTLTDADWQQRLGDRPALLLFTNGEGVRGEFSTAFKKAAAENKAIVFAQVDPTKNPQLAQHFNAGDKPVLVGFYCGETHVRRVRPWGADVVLTIELLQTMKPEEKPVMNEEKMPVVATDKPVHVEQENFNTDIVEYSKSLPVLVDFWAEWCGPCRQVAPILDKLAKEFAGQVRIAKIDTDANQDLAMALQIQSIPTIMAFKDGELVFRNAGAYPERVFRDLIQQLISLDVQAAKKQAEEKNPNA